MIQEEPTEQIKDISYRSFSQRIEACYNLIPSSQKPLTVISEPHNVDIKFLGLGIKMACLVNQFLNVLTMYDWETKYGLQKIDLKLMKWYCTNKSKNNSKYVSILYRVFLMVLQGCHQKLPKIFSKTWQQPHPVRSAQIHPRLTLVQVLTGYPIYSLHKDAPSIESIT